ncbi:hypothetical protein [Pseudonocardia parietis]|uniref:Uncharacterized protein n=1 Tax=Pseudonocardia parietis TaxID=570936 RepID=A0ABS4W5M5_9PSEU|nr:hypothetical protein [Pseudonocardia parietis]MBP2371418.1 hypothetical protein [Pseudonocardia parietis]
MGHHILDHDGPLLATSTKPDLYNYCAGARAEKGPVWLFNPEQLGDLGSSVWWSPVAGCADAQVAAIRAGLMVGGVSAGEDGGDRWDKWSVSVLSALLMAADLSGRDMTTVARWVFSPTSDPRRGGAGEAVEVLGRAPGVPAGTLDALRQVLATDARKTRDSIFMTLSEAVKFMTDPQVAALVTGSGGGQERSTTRCEAISSCSTSHSTRIPRPVPHPRATTQATALTLAGPGYCASLARRRPGEEPTGAAGSGPTRMPRSTRGPATRGAAGGAAVQAEAWPSIARSWPLSRCPWPRARCSLLAPGSVHSCWSVLGAQSARADRAEHEPEIPTSRTPRARLRGGPADEEDPATATM